MDFKLTAVAACKVADIDRGRFNEHVAAGKYPCAPKTISGSARHFEENDLVALFVFARLLEQNTKAEIAGTIACMILERINDGSGAETASIGVPFSTNAALIPVHAWHPDNLFNGYRLPLLSATHYNIKEVRRVVRDRSQEFYNVFGPEDDA